jgi:hypothetical protein
VSGPIIKAMQAQELKTLVETGAYKPDPDQIAMAMLRRRGVRELLTGLQAGPAPDGRTQQSAAFGHQAA